MLVSVASAFASVPDYTSVTLSTTEINLDDENASISLLVDGELDSTNQMYAQFGMVANQLTNAYLYEGTATEGVKLDNVEVAWGKPVNFIADIETLKYDTEYKLVIKAGGLSAKSYMTGSYVLQNSEDITLTFKTLVGCTDPFIKSAKFNVEDKQTVDLDDPAFEGIKLKVKAMNLPTVGAYLVYQGGVRLYDLDGPEDKYSFCAVTNVAVSAEEILLCPKSQFAKGKNYKVVIPKESLFVHNYFDMMKEVCYFNTDEVVFYTKYEDPTEAINATCTINTDKVKVSNADADQNTFVFILRDDALKDGQTAEDFAMAQLATTNPSKLHKGTFDAYYTEFLWGLYEGDHSVVIMGAEYDATREACYATTTPKVVHFSVDQDGNVVDALSEIAVVLCAAEETEYALVGTVTIDKPVSAIKVSGLSQSLSDASYAICGPDNTTLASGILSINTIGYAEFTPVEMYENNEYTVVVTANEETIFEQTILGGMEEEGSPLELKVSLVAFDECEYAPNPERIVTIDVPIKGIKVEGLEQGTSVSYTLEDNGNILAEGEISDNSIACPEFGPFYFYEMHTYTLTLTSGSKTVYTANFVGAMEVYSALKDLLGVIGTWYGNNSDDLYDEILLDLDEAISAGQAATYMTSDDELLTLIGNLQTAFVNAKAGLALVEELKATSAELSKAYELYAASASSEVLDKAESLLTMSEDYLSLTDDMIQQLLDDMKECLKELGPVNVTLNECGLATFSAPVAVSISGADAYVATYDEGSSQLNAVAIEGDIPANTGVILKGEAGATVTISEPTGTAANVADNDLIASSVEKSQDYIAYVLDGDVFKRWDDELLPNKAYLEFLSDPSSNLRLVFDDVTAIFGITADAARNGKFIKNARVVIVKDGKKFNVAGQSVK